MIVIVIDGMRAGTKGQGETVPPRQGVPAVQVAESTREHGWVGRQTWSREGEEGEEGEERDGKRGEERDGKRGKG